MRSSLGNRAQKVTLAPRTALNRDLGHETRLLATLSRLLVVVGASGDDTGQPDGDNGGGCLHGWQEAGALPLAEFQAQKTTEPRTAQ
jgi:hypothetical protein